MDWFGGLVKLIQKYNWRCLLRSISMIGWFLTPFLLWLIIYVLLGSAIFNYSWVQTGGIISAILLLAFVIYITYDNVKNILLRNKLIRTVENARKVFDNPSDSQCEKNFRNECGKFIIPFLYFRRFNDIALTDYFKNSKEGLLNRLAFIVLSLLWSYFFFGFLLSHQAFFITIFAFSYPLLTTLELSSIPPFLYQNFLLLSLISFLLCTAVATRMYKGMGRFPSVLADITNDYFSVFMRVCVLGCFVFSSPWEIKESINSQKYSPFMLQPITTVSIIQQSVKNVEQTECQVTVWQYEVDSIEDVQQLRDLINKNADFHLSYSFISQRATNEKILERINETKPLLYLGIINNRCAIVGTITHSKEERLLKAKFFFDNWRVKDMFKSMVDIQTEEQKKLSSKIPNNLAEVVKSINISDGD